MENKKVSSTELELKTKRRPEYIMKTLRKREGLDENDRSYDHELNKLSDADVLNEIATWNGFLGYGDTIISWIEDIYGIEL